MKSSTANRIYDIVSEIEFLRRALFITIFEIMQIVKRANMKRQLKDLSSARPIAIAIDTLLIRSKTGCKLAKGC